MSNQIQLTTSYINKLDPVAVATDKAIGDHFVKKYMDMYRAPKEQAVAFYEREKDNFMKRVSEADAIRQCTPLSIFLAFMQVGGWKLSFEGGSQADVYLIPGNRNIGTKDNPKWIKEVVAQPSPYGEKKIRIETGQIKHVGTPTVVYDCDTYKESLGEDGRTTVEWTKGSRTSKSKIIGSFILLEYPDGSREFKTFDQEDITSWRNASAKKNRGIANVLYTSNAGQIDPKFLQGKTLKHAFKLFPRVIAAPKMPENFIPEGEDAIRQGFDTSEFTETEDTTYEEVPNVEESEFDKELKEQSKVTPEKTVVIPVAEDDDEPDF